MIDARSSIQYRASNSLIQLQHSRQFRDGDGQVVKAVSGHRDGEPSDAIGEFGAYSLGNRLSPDFCQPQAGDRRAHHVKHRADRPAEVGERLRMLWNVNVQIHQVFLRDEIELVKGASHEFNLEDLSGG